MTSITTSSKLTASSPIPFCPSRNAPSRASLDHSRAACLQFLLEAFPALTFRTASHQVTCFWLSTISIASALILPTSHQVVQVPTSVNTCIQVSLPVQDSPESSCCLNMPSHCTHSCTHHILYTVYSGLLHIPWQQMGLTHFAKPDT